MPRVGVIDDYLNIAQASADWDRLPNDVAVEFHQDHLTDRAALVERLQPYDVLVISSLRAGSCPISARGNAVRSRMITSTS